MSQAFTIQNDDPTRELLIQLVDAHGVSEPFALPPRLAQRLVVMSGKSMRITEGRDPRETDSDTDESELARQVREELSGE